PDRTGEDGPEWERVLWRLKPFPDNYVPPTFLAGLSKNPNVLPYRYWPLVMLGACTISQHLSGRARTVKASLLVFLALIALAPILRTLTAPTSTDSISALTTTLFLVHAALADYSYAASHVRRERCVSFLLFWRISKTHRVGKD
ncbi:hypothetical protein F5888DRAFT_1737076, partial [Russula emetica]